MKPHHAQLCTRAPLRLRIQKADIILADGELFYRSTMSCPCRLGGDSSQLRRSDRVRQQRCAIDADEDHSSTLQILCIALLARRRVLQSGADETSVGPRCTTKSTTSRMPSKRQTRLSMPQHEDCIHSSILLFSRSAHSPIDHFHCQLTEQKPPAIDSNKVRRASSCEYVVMLAGAARYTSEQQHLQWCLPLKSCGMSCNAQNLQSAQQSIFSFVA